MFVSLNLMYQHNLIILILYMRVVQTEKHMIKEAYYHALVIILKTIIH